jgi:hypothetical protein
MLCVIPEAALTVLAGSLCCLTIALPDWLEAIFGFDSDAHSGGLERVVSVSLLLLALALGAHVRLRIRRNKLAWKSNVS